jgi:hypothetical protein
MNMPRIRVREILLLILPLIFIGAIGLYLSRRPMPPTSGPWRVVIEEAKVVPVAPVDAYDGYDTKAIVTAHVENETEDDNTQTSSFFGVRRRDFTQLAACRNILSRELKM